jgi:hypothetical protein
MEEIVLTDLSPPGAEPLSALGLIPERRARQTAETAADLKP